jgi:hypothetical protein
MIPDGRRRHLDPAGEDRLNAEEERRSLDPFAGVGKVIRLSIV